MLFLVGFTFFSNAIRDLLDEKIVHFNKSAIILMIVSVIVKEILARYSFLCFKKSKSSSLLADAWHHRTDAITSFVILLGIVLGSNFWWMDSVLSILVSLVIFYTAFDIIKNSVKKLVGEAPSRELIENIKNIVEKNGENSNTLHHFHVHIYGEHVEITFHMRFKNDTTVFDAHNKVEEISKEIKDILNVEPTIHIEGEL